MLLLEKINCIRKHVIENEKISVFILLSLFFLILIIRNIGLYPFCFSDEYTYSKFSRLLSFSEANIPSYLFYFFYSVTNYFGDSFLDAARFLNVVFYTISSFFIYDICVKNISKNLSFLVVFFVLVSPFNGYTAYFMPESLYFLSFWIFSWFILRLDEKSSKRMFCIAGSILGISSLIKPHALFFIPSIILYILLLNFDKKINFLINTIYFLFFCFFSKFFLGYLIAGKAAFTLFGTLYGGIASSGSKIYDYWNLFLSSFYSLIGHIQCIVIVYSLPFIAGFSIILRKDFFSKNDYITKRIIVYTFLMLINMLFIVSMFTMKVAGSGPYESADRLHMRYYSFIIPFLYIISFHVMSDIKLIKKNIYKYGLIFLSFLLFLRINGMRDISVSFIDCPELIFLEHKFSFYFISFLSLFSIILLFFSIKKSFQFYNLFFLPIFILYSFFSLSNKLIKNINPDVYNKAGIVIKNSLSNRDSSDLVIVGNMVAGLFKSAYHIDNPDVSIEGLSNQPIYDVDKNLSNKKWFLFFNECSINGNFKTFIKCNGFHLVRKLKTIEDLDIDFSKNTLLYDILGLSAQEAKGRWSDGDTVFMDFVDHIPQVFDLSLDCDVFITNIGKTAILDFCGDQKKILLDNANINKTFSFSIKNDKCSSMIWHIPVSKSPKELGLSEDDRKLGVFFKKIKIKVKS